LAGVGDILLDVTGAGDMPNLQVLADRLLRILPPDGSQMANDEARTLLEQAVEAPLEGETYFSIIALLERNGDILQCTSSKDANSSKHAAATWWCWIESGWRRWRAFPTVSWKLQMGT
jgi:hypothetical protein